MECGANCVSTALFGCVCDTCEGGAIWKIVSEVIKIMTAGIGILAVIGIVVAGIAYLTSAGDAAKMQKAKRRIIEVVIGLVAYAVLFAIGEFLVPGGIVRSTLDSSTSSCTAAPSTGSGSSGSGSSGSGSSGSSSSGSGSGSSGSSSGTTNPGSGYASDMEKIKNALENSGLSGEKAAYFMSAPVSACPKNSKSSNAGTMIDYAAGALSQYAIRNPSEAATGAYSIVNTPINVLKYWEYLRNNNISMDSKICKTNGECNDSGNTYSDDGNCEKFAPVFAGNLAGNMCVSNDIFAGHMGRTDTRMYSQDLRRSYTDLDSDINKINKLYFDPGLNFNSDGKSPAIYPTNVVEYSSRCAMAKTILSELIDHGRPVVVRVGVGSGHWTVAVGVKTSVKDKYKAGTLGCGLNSSDLVFLNTDRDIRTFGFNGDEGGKYILMTYCGRSTCN